MNIKIKTCGLFRQEDIFYVNTLKPDFVGFVFVPSSKRNVSIQQAYEFKKKLDNICVVGVFANNSKEHILEIVRAGIIDMIQLHGTESEDFIEDLKKVCFISIIKAIRVESVESFFIPTLADYVLYDNASGGSGMQFDWGLLQEAQKRGLQREFFLAGGIGTDNIKQAMCFKPYAIDVSSGIEHKGVKDLSKMTNIINAVRGVSSE